MGRALYSFLMWLAQPLLRRKLARRARLEPRYAMAVGQRFGNYGSEPVPQKNSAVKRVWVHAVSLGETRAAAVLLAELRMTYPGLSILLTHGTATGWEQGLALLQPGDLQAWLPWDTPRAVGAFLDRFKPDVGLLMETEVWPNLVAVCAQKQIALCLVNARLSEKSLRQALRLRWLSFAAYRGLRAVWAQTEADAARLQRLGARVLGVTGNLKFDARPDPSQLEQGRHWRQQQSRPVVLFASSREGEEAQLLDVLQTLDAAVVACVQWLIVPRHPQRFSDVATLLQSRGWSFSLRSSWSGLPPHAPLWIGDSVGEMALYYGLADLALLGGSFAPLGGQNLIESAACGCPIVMGPHTFNFADASQQAEEAGAAMRVTDMGAAVVRALHLLQNPEALAHARRQALAWSEAHRGAALRTVQALAPLLEVSRA